MRAPRAHTPSPCGYCAARNTPPLRGYCAARNTPCRPATSLRSIRRASRLRRATASPNGIERSDSLRSPSQNETDRRNPLLATAPAFPFPRKIKRLTHPNRGFPIERSTPFPASLPHRLKNRRRHIPALALCIPTGEFFDAPLLQRVVRPVAPQNYDENAALSGTIPQKPQYPPLVAVSLPRRRQNRLLSQNDGDDQA